MKKVISTVLLVLMSLSLVACGKNEDEKKEIIPQSSQMKSICELATMDCYYHNVAKYNEEDASGIWLWKKDRKFWIEYAGVVTVGIDASLVNMEVKDDTVTITLPPAKILGCKVDESTLTEDSFIVAKDSAKVEAEHQTAAFQEAQDNMRKEAEKDTVLLASAQQRAQKLLEDYVNNIGACTGKTYTIKWVYLDGAKELQEPESE